MYTEAKKIQLISAVIQMESEVVLNKIDVLLKESKPTFKKNKISAQNFKGTISNQDADLITKAIAEGCEQIDADGWK